VKRMVLDASALMAFFEARRGGVTVHEFLSLAADGKLQIAMGGL
jgi:PIN domain nuclease of toxin-antitoxin system